MTDPNYDVCVYCAAPGCSDGTAEHTADCPSVTGVFPVRESDIFERTVCEKCGHRNRTGMGCCRCEHQFEKPVKGRGCTMPRCSRSCVLGARRERSWGCEALRAVVPDLWVRDYGAVPEASVARPETLQDVRAACYRGRDRP